VGPYDSWQAVVLVSATAALVGAGLGAAAALVFAERRVGDVEDAVDRIERRVSFLERLDDRVKRLESGGQLRPAEG
jgi:hypothetical protein